MNVKQREREDHLDRYLKPVKKYHVLMVETAAHAGNQNDAVVVDANLHLHLLRFAVCIGLDALQLVRANERFRVGHAVRLVVHIDRHWLLAVHGQQPTEWGRVVLFEHFHLMRTIGIRPGDQHRIGLHIRAAKLAYAYGRRKDSTLQCRTARNCLVLVERSTCRFAENLFNQLLDSWNAAATTDDLDRVNIFRRKLGVDQ
uniref:Uncharacterized protein n=1 Tax=Anopheles farauti TaxID=69004 RepID=A0A182Q2J4_9DIPT